MGNRSCVLHRVEPEKLIIMATVQALHDFHDWLSEHEEKLEEYAANKPKTRVQACQLLAIATDMSELTKALNSGGAGKLTVEKLEDSISQLKEMFRERATLIENMASTPGAAEDDVDDYY